MGTAKNLPGARLFDLTGSNRSILTLYTMGDRAMFRAYFGAIPEAWVSVFGRPQSKYWKATYKALKIPETDMQHVNYMLRKGLIIPKTSGFRAQLEQGNYLENLQLQLVKDPNAKFGYKLVRPKGETLDYIGSRDQNDIMFEKSVLQAYRSDRSPAWKQVLYPWKIFGTISKLAIIGERAGKIGGYHVVRRLREQGKLTMSENEMLQRIVSDSGSPNFLNHGKAHNIINMIFLYQNAWQRGVTRDMVNLIERPKEVGWKYAKYSLGPKAIQWMATLGVLGPMVAELFDGIPEYDQQNYLVLPLGKTTDGRVVYMRFALDETSRVLAGTMHDSIMAENFNFFDLFKTPISTGTPGFNPIIDFFRQFFDSAFGTDDVPFDNFTKRPMIDKGLWGTLNLYGDNPDSNVQNFTTSRYMNMTFEEMQKHFMADSGIDLIDENMSKARFEALKAVYNKFSGTGFYKFKSNTNAGVSSELGTIFGLDVTDVDGTGIKLGSLDEFGTGPILNRIIKIGKDPLSEKIIKPVEDAKRNTDAIFSYADNEAIEKMFDNPKELTATDIKIIESKIIDGSLQKSPLFKKKLIAKEGGSIFLQDLENVKSVKEKLLILNNIMNYIKDPYQKESLEKILKQKIKTD
jgi:hypothetical protein